MTAPDIAFTDPRVRMRDALRHLVARDAQWRDEPSVVFRNRLLDETGSDARPLADLLMEALRRGWRERMLERAPAAEPFATPLWDATVAPFIMQWSAERFVQPDMARWAVECWGYALGMITSEQIRVAPPPRAPASGSAPVVGRHTTVASTGLLGTSGHAHPRSPPHTAKTSGKAPRFGTAAARTPSGARGGSAPSIGLSFPRASTKPIGFTPSRTATSASYTAARGGARPLNPWITRVLAMVLVGMTGALLWSVGTRKRDVQVTGESGRPGTGIVGAGVPSNPIAPRPPAASNPGVPSITRDVGTGAALDSARMMFVNPVRRAAGTGVPVPAGRASAGTSIPVALDELRLEDGSRLQGRVEIVRAGTVIFRDVQTGLRQEINKDEISEIITEFGTSVRFRAATPARTVAERLTGTVVAGARGSGARAGGVRGAGVGGRYLVRYDAATAKGSPECASVWQRPPNTVDRATVRHVAGADTLVITFDGGDSFPSNIDHDGYFASTFRIVPDQARTSTALTTRLNGRFNGDGTLALEVNIVFFRRMRTGGDLGCNVTITAAGTRQSD